MSAVHPFDRELFETTIAVATMRVAENVPEAETLTPQERCIDMARRIDNHKLYSVQSRTGVLPSMETVEAQFAELFGSGRV